MQGLARVLSRFMFPGPVGCDAEEGSQDEVGGALKTGSGMCDMTIEVLVTPPRCSTIRQQSWVCVAVEEGCFRAVEVSCA